MPAAYEFAKSIYEALACADDTNTRTERYEAKLAWYAGHGAEFYGSARGKWQEEKIPPVSWGETLSRRPKAGWAEVKANMFADASAAEKAGFRTEYLDAKIGSWKKVPDRFSLPDDGRVYRVYPEDLKAWESKKQGKRLDTTDGKKFEPWWKIQEPEGGANHGPDMTEYDRDICAIWTDLWLRRNDLRLREMTPVEIAVEIAAAAWGAATEAASESKADKEEEQVAGCGCSKEALESALVFDPQLLDQTHDFPSDDSSDDEDLWADGAIREVAKKFLSKFRFVSEGEELRPGDVEIKPSGEVVAAEVPPKAPARGEENSLFFRKIDTEKGGDQ